MPSPFQNRTPNIAGNKQLRDPQREAYGHLADFARETTDEREVGIVLPVGCGKSGTIAITPFAFRSVRTLVVAPNVAIDRYCMDCARKIVDGSLASLTTVSSGLESGDAVSVGEEAVCVVQE